MVDEWWRCGWWQQRKSGGVGNDNWGRDVKYFRLPVMLRAQTRHPLDPLTAAEISVAVATVRAAGATLEVRDTREWKWQKRPNRREGNMVNNIYMVKGIQLIFSRNVKQYFVDILFGGLVHVNDIHQADACKATPAKFCGSKEVVPLHFRKVENRRQGEMAQQRQRATTKGKENEQPSGSNGKEKNKAIVNNLPPTWPKATIFKNLKLNFMDMRALGAMLEEIETDIICLEALDKVEQQFTEQEEKQGKKPRRKVAKRRLEFDEL
ncbi:hypothetical protein RHGRI_010798 [Rhododendron griersonianum]|uniref:Uncharacterized protein n=1 Tax=Rhododendron griersonianum TaxID=479676 RepID=A0AAV6KJY4_9ERIC|nr:hypothetical protein RHGRI_010798 [Rhododendron griersonianum]